MADATVNAAADRLRAVAAWAPGYAAALINLAGEIEEAGGPDGPGPAWAAGVAAVILTGETPDV